GVMAAGYACGPGLSPNYPRRGRFLLALGAALTLAFLVLRGLNRYGDPEPWSAQANVLFTAFSFINCQKYPPSLDYLLMTLGPALLAMAWLEYRGGAPGPLVTFGRVPLFFYVLHLPLIHALAVLLSLLRHGQAGGLFVEPPWSQGCADL